MGSVSLELFFTNMKFVLILSTIVTLISAGPPGSPCRGNADCDYMLACLKDRTGDIKGVCVDGQ